MSQNAKSRRDFGRPEPAGFAATAGYERDAELVRDIVAIVSLLGASHPAHRHAAFWRWHLAYRRLRATRAGEDLCVELTRARLSEQQTLLLVCVLASDAPTMESIAQRMYGGGSAMRIEAALGELARRGLVTVTSISGLVPQLTDIEPCPRLAACWRAAARR